MLSSYSGSCVPVSYDSDNLNRSDPGHYTQTGFSLSLEPEPVSRKSHMYIDRNAEE